MNKKLYNLMDWAEMEAVTYSEEEHPKKLLGPHPVGNQTLVQAFLPHAKSVNLRIGKAVKPVPMELADESGHYAALVRNKYPFHYVYEIENEDGSISISEDPYAFPQIILERQLKKFQNGILYKAWETLGAHVTEVNGIKGVHFAVWAPNAMRVSVVGDFNGWDGRIHEMELLGTSGIFELFIPDVKPGDLYKYEIKAGNGTVTLKSDPYGFQAELRPNTASIVADINYFNWSDGEWMTKRGDYQSDKAPMAVYELYLGAFLKATADDSKSEDSSNEIAPSGEGGGSAAFPNYREIAPLLAKYVLDMGYTHIELMPIMEHMADSSLGFQTLGYYAPTSRYGSPQDFAYFVNYMHEKGIGVIVDWSVAHFPCEPNGLMQFDGAALYESSDPKRSFHPEWGTLTFDYSKQEVRNYLIANALFWLTVYHVDGLRADALSTMLYLDYGRQDNDFTPNIYGGRENLDAVGFLKDLTDVIHKMGLGAILIAEETSSWSMVTGKTAEGGLGFDYKWNTSWRNDFLGYMNYDPFYRTHHYGELCFSMVYAYAENFILPLTHDAFIRGKGSFLMRMPGNAEEKMANLKAGLSYFLTSPGKKALFMGMDIGEEREWEEPNAIDWKLLDIQENKELNLMVRDLLHLYREKPALYELSSSENGFEWINCISAQENILVYLRKTENPGDTLLVVVNFANTPRKNYKIGVPFPGKYKEIFNCDAEKYGGFDFRNHRILKSVQDECDGRPDSIRIKVPPLAACIFEVQPV